MKTFKVQVLKEEFPFLSKIEGYLFQQAFNEGLVEVKRVDENILVKTLRSKDCEIQSYDPQTWEIGWIISEKARDIITEVKEETFLEQLKRSKVTDPIHLVKFSYRYEGGFAGRMGHEEKMITIYKPARGEIVQKTILNALANERAKLKSEINF